MKYASDILNGIAVSDQRGPENPALHGLTSDSRGMGQGFAFVAVKGTVSDGHQFIPAVLKSGASMVVCEKLPSAEISSAYPDCLFVETENTSRALGLMACNWYGHPSRRMKLLAITGTNGKTTTATLSYQLFRQLGYRCGLLSTVENQIDGKTLPATHTTPDPVSLNALLAEMLAAGCSHVFMEASSHAIHQERIAGLHFAGAVFTNISHDHLDYHGSFENYIAAKKKLFDELPAGTFSLVNADDRRGKVMVQNTHSKTYSYSINSSASFRARILSDSLQGLQLEINGKEVWFRLVGKFNASNLLAVYGAAVLLGEKEEEVLLALSSLPPVRGRFERIPLKKGSTAIVDYAHTPDALQNVLETIKSIQQSGEQLITVVGCGGNRDRAKRPVMAATASRLSTQVFLTSDNPRDEEPSAILQEMLAGVPLSARRKVAIIEDRHAAIREALSMANRNDVVLVAGKGHETYQEIKGVRYPFDDRAKILETENPVLN
jgi:UDP-N-acetylmuramoyl-L-alanyl-D-glutamate--2,6-diaminopimelate ligase